MTPVDVVTLMELPTDTRAIGQVRVCCFDTRYCCLY
jgi:hypothetical protein